MAGIKIIKCDFLFLVSDHIPSMYDHFICGRKTKKSVYVGIILTLWFPRIIHLIGPKTMAKNDKYLADMAIGSQRSFKLWTLLPNCSWSTIFLACQVCPHYKNLWKKHMIAHGAQHLLKNSHIVNPEGAEIWWPYGLFRVVRGDLFT